MTSIVNKSISKNIQESSKSFIDPAGRELRIIEDIQTLSMAEELGCTVHEIYVESLRQGIYPYRYVRNLKVITANEQLRLAESSVVVVGAGGLGGEVLILLSRLGIGHLLVVDHDVFDETNLNRQALSRNNNLGSLKAEEAIKELKSINPGVKVTSYPEKINRSNSIKILKGSDVIVDALDNTFDRFVLEAAAKNLGIPLVHGAVAGFEGHLMTIFPKDRGLELIYGKGPIPRVIKSAPESILGIPALTPAIIASFQVMEVLKIILGRGAVIRNHLFYLDLEAGLIDTFSFDESS